MGPSRSADKLRVVRSGCGDVINLVRGSSVRFGKNSLRLRGDEFFYYLGSYSSVDGRWKGEMLNQENTPTRGDNPAFGGYEVGIGFSGDLHIRQRRGAPPRARPGATLSARLVHR
jgi:hypothetical protein